MKLLTAVNMVLRASAKPAVNELDPQAQLSSYAERAINEARRFILSQGWRFNTRRTKLVPDNTGRVPISKDYLDVTFKEDKHAVQKFDTTEDLYVWNHDENAWEDEEIIDVEVVFDIPDGDEAFRTLPEKLAMWITYKAAATYFSETKNGTTNQKLELQAIRAQSTWINGQPSRTLDQVTGFSRIAASHVVAPHTAFDPRHQTFTP